MTEIVLTFPETGGITLSAVGIQGPGGGGGGGVTDGDKGGIIVSGSGAVWTVKDGSITDLMLGASAIALFAAASHTHSIANITGLQAALDGKAAASHTHVAADVTDFAATTRATTLTGYAAAGSRLALAAGDTILGAFGKVGKWLADLAAIAFSGSASDLSAGTVPAARMPAHTGDVTSSAGSVALTLATVNSNVGSFGLAGSVAQFVVNAKGLITSAVNVAISIASAAISDSTAAGRAMLTAATAAAQTALLDVFTSGAKGLAPASGGGTTNFLRADGSWAAPGGGSPGGSSGEVQYNNAGAFAGAADVEIEGGQLRLPAISTPSAPAAGGVKLFGAASAEGARPAVESESGWPEWLQSAIAKSAVSYFQPVGTNVITMSFGCIVSAQSSDTTTAKTMATTNAYTRARGVESLKTGAAVNNCAGHRFNSAQWRTGGGGAGQGGFRSHMIFGPATGVTALHCAFCGLYSVVGNAPDDKEPSAVTDLFGFGYDSGDSNIQFLHNDGSGTATKIDLGASFPKPSADRTHVYDCEMYSPPGTTQMVAYRITNRATGAVASGVVTTNLPSDSTYLTPHIWARIAASAVIGIMDGGIYIETLGNA